MRRGSTGKWLIQLVSALSLGGCLPDSFAGYTYRAEVGYYESDKQTWYVGPDTTREQCQSEAEGAPLRTTNTQSLKA